jgi:hypothetical protein
VRRWKPRSLCCGSRSSCCDGAGPVGCLFWLSTEWCWVGFAGCFRKRARHSVSFGPTPWCDGIALVFRCYWRRKLRRCQGRPGVPAEIQQLIRQMSVANTLWGAPRIHGELLRLGIDVGHTSVAKYMACRRAPPSLGWKTFLRNHADGLQIGGGPYIRKEQRTRFFRRQIAGTDLLME